MEILSRRRGNRIDAYLAKYGGSNLDICEGGTVAIPTKRIGSSTNFVKQNQQWRTNRDLNSYRGILFPDEFEFASQNEDIYHKKAVKRTDPSLLAGGEAWAFRPGNVVVELGSGQAVALLQLSQKFPNTAFIGIDKGYEKVKALNLKRAAGVQLTHDDWSSLATLPDKSVDTILSVQGLFVWGIGRSGTANEVEIESIMESLSRVSKPDTILRADMLTDGYFPVAELLEGYGWQVTTLPTPAPFLTLTIIAQHQAT